MRVKVLHSLIAAWAPGVAAVYPHLRPAPYDTLRDFAPVSLVAFNSTMLVVNAGMPVESAVDLAAMAREKPGLDRPQSFQVQ